MTTATIDTLSVLRYATAETKSTLLAEVAAPESMDHGTGTRFAGLCVAVEAGQELDVQRFIDRPEQYIRLELGHVSSVAHLAAHIQTQFVSARRRTMWRLVVHREDIVGLADREIGGPGCRILHVDGVLLKPGAKVLSVTKVAV